MDMFGIDKELIELKERIKEFDILLKLMISVGIRNNAIQNNKSDYDSEIEQISLIFNKLQEKINKSKRSD